MRINSSDINIEALRHLLCVEPQVLINEREEARDRADDWMIFILILLNYFASIMDINYKFLNSNQEVTDNTISVADGILSYGMMHSYMLGRKSAGNLTSMSDHEMMEIEPMIDDNVDYFDAFLLAILAGMDEESRTKRVAKYEASLRKIYWIGFAKGDKSKTRRIQWIMDPAKEHCSDCLRFSQKGPMTMDEFYNECLSKDLVPQSYNLECRGFNCGCYLKDIYEEDNANG